MAERTGEPSKDVLAEFGLTGDPKPVTGGQNSSWTVNNAILKRWTPQDSVMIEWQCALQAQLHNLVSSDPNPRYRIALPLPTKASGRYIFKEWTATNFVEGVEDLDLELRLPELLSASRAMHADLQKLVKEAPPEMAKQNHRWAQSERVVWVEMTFDQVTNPGKELYCRLTEYLEALEEYRRPLKANEYTRQLVHGDLSGNLLFAPRDQKDLYPPAIIDFTPQWRPVEFSEAIVIADALTWQNKGIQFVRDVGLTELRFQMIVRALMFRILTYAIDIDEEFVERNLKNMDIIHALSVIRECAQSLEDQIVLGQ